MCKQHQFLLMYTMATPSISNYLSKHQIGCPSRGRTNPVLSKALLPKAAVQQVFVVEGSREPFLLQEHVYASAFAKSRLAVRRSMKDSRGNCIVKFEERRCGRYYLRLSSSFYPLRHQYNYSSSLVQYLLLLCGVETKDG